MLLPQTESSIILHQSSVQDKIEERKLQSEVKDTMSLMRGQQKDEERYKAQRRALGLEAATPSMSVAAVDAAVSSQRLPGPSEGYKEAPNPGGKPGAGLPPVPPSGGNTGVPRAALAKQAEARHEADVKQAAAAVETVNKGVV